MLRGARQVGKTTVINKFGESFDNFIYLNLELLSDRKFFDDERRSLNDIMQMIYLEKKKENNGNTLLFLDEIQNSANAVQRMRYFFEDMPDLYVIGAGSLLEIMMDTHKISFPVGRVEYRYLYPMCFEEFLHATGEEEVLSNYKKTPAPEWSLDRIAKLFHHYSLIGGMPEAVSLFIENNNIFSLKPVYQGLLTSYTDDVSKYAKNNSNAMIIRHILESSAFEAGKRITFVKFGNSPYRSREVGDSLRTLERAMLLYLRYPTTQTKIPLFPDKRKKPKLQLIDTGLLNYAAGLQNEYFRHDNLNSFYNGILAEHIVAQEIIANDNYQIKKPLFWVREKRQSSAEIDIILQYGNRVIPVEIKSGKQGTLRSLHSYVDISGSKNAIRLYSGGISIKDSITPRGTKFKLMNLPYCFASRISNYLKWMESEI